AAQPSKEDQSDEPTARVALIRQRWTAADRPFRAAQPQPTAVRSQGSRHSRFRLKLTAGFVASAALLGIIVYIATDNGTVKITGSDSRMKIAIDRNDVTIENLGQPITFRTGTHTLEAERDGLKFKTDSFQIRRGEETVLDVTYIPAPP